MFELTELMQLASLVFVVNLAYLRSDRFRIQSTVKKLADDALESLGDVPEELKKLEVYTQLTFLAGQNSVENDPCSVQLPGLWGKLYTSIIWRGWERRHALFATIISLVFLGFGTLGSVDEFNWMKNWDPLVTLFVFRLPMISSLVFTIIFALADDHIISKATVLISKCSKELEKTLTAVREAGACRCKRTPGATPSGGRRIGLGIGCFSRFWQN